jgi:DNA-binding LacI/PurR family transcriptional regulator
LLDLPEPPTAIFAVNDLAALGVYEVARRRGLRIPEQLAVVGYNDILAARRLVPALTTVRVPVHEFGRAAADMLIDQVERGRAAPGRIVFPPELIVRDSTRPRG